MSPPWAGTALVYIISRGDSACTGEHHYVLANRKTAKANKHTNIVSEMAVIDVNYIDKGKKTQTKIQ